MPCEEKVVLLEAEIQNLQNVISDQQHYIEELHKSQSQQLENIPNLHLGTGNQHRGRSVAKVYLSAAQTSSIISLSAFPHSQSSIFISLHCIQTSSLVSTLNTCLCVFRLLRGVC